MVADIRRCWSCDCFDGLRFEMIVELSDSTTLRDVGDFVRGRIYCRDGFLLKQIFIVKGYFNIA